MNDFAGDKPGLRHSSTNIMSAFELVCLQHLSLLSTMCLSSFFWSQHISNLHQHQSSVLLLEPWDLNWRWFASWLLLAAQASAWLASQLHNNLFLGPWIAWFNMFLFIPQMVALGGTSVDLQARLSQLSDVIHAPQLASWQQAVPYLDQL